MTIRSTPYYGRVVYDARRWGLKLGRLKPPPIRIQVPPPKSRDQELYERRRSRYYDRS